LFEPRLTGDALVDGLSQARWPGRFEPCPAHPQVWWDGAHNPQGAAILRDTWREALRDVPATLLLGVSDDKDAQACWPRSPGRGPAWTRCARGCRGPWTIARSPRSWRLRGPRPPCVPRAPWERRCRTLSSARETVLVCGSLFVVGEAMAACGAGDLEQL
jgi:dihydrofolate synthase/folylpolyglutamate synthase